MRDSRQKNRHTTEQNQKERERLFGMAYYNIACVCDDIPRHRHKRKSLHRHQQPANPTETQPKKNLKARRIGSIIIRRPEKEEDGRPAAWWWEPHDPEACGSIVCEENLKN